VVVDTSALIAVLFGEPERDALIAQLSTADDPLISAGTLLEASIVMLARTGETGLRALDELLAAAGVRCVAVDGDHVRLATEAFARFGKGRSPAGLNLGDCFAYSLAKAAGRPLLFKGSDFGQTDITSAIA
jgi:ribonuclease VapC